MTDADCEGITFVGPTIIEPPSLTTASGLGPITFYNKPIGLFSDTDGDGLSDLHDIAVGGGSGGSIATLERFCSGELCDPVSSIVIAARGQQGREAMQLEINGQIMETWTVGNSNTFERYTAHLAEPVLIESLRVNYINDGGLPPMNRNLFVDYIEIEG